MSHRGRDDEGFFIYDGSASRNFRGDNSAAELQGMPHVDSVEYGHVALGHKRLSIIDLGAGGHQPMMSSSGRYSIVYNGEIYNYLELRQQLIGLGHDFKTESDTEVLLACLEQWGLDGFAKLNGMWATAIFDSVERRLILSRDRFGIKPLYYTKQADILYFASEVKFLLDLLQASKVNTQRAKEYLVHGLVDHHEETMFEQIFQIPPAHWAVWNEAGLRFQRYWDLKKTSLDIPLEEAVSQLRELLFSSVSLRLRSDVPVGSSLSGGLDSSVIVAIIKSMLDSAQGQGSFDLFSAVFKEEAFSEHTYIKDTVTQTGLPIHWITPRPEKIFDSLPKMLWHQEFPFRSLSVYSQWSIMQAVAKTPIKVVLNGQGSDEIFGGYTNHHYALIADLVRSLRFGKAYREVKSLALSREYSLGGILRHSARSLIRQQFPSFGTMGRKLAYLNGTYAPIDTYHRHDGAFNTLLYRNLTTASLPEYLRYEDRNSMAFTLESRLPFLDYRLVEWAMSLPAQFKITNSTSKLVLREMSRNLIPASISDRRDKMGFISPQEIWQRGALKEPIEHVFDSTIQDRMPFLNQHGLNVLYQEYVDGKNDDWALIWRIVCLVLWYDVWIG